ncbi:MAG: hypothetical protein HY755_02735 [Nitrospirae bacterium]|nr:hypothetical protein [Nitrospirota bacterium]
MDEKEKDEKTIKAVEKALGEPVIGEFTENTIKIRRNLLIVSLLSVAVSLGGLQINPNSEVFGLKFSGLTDNFIRFGLTLITLYLFIHFLWCSFEFVHGMEDKNHWN